MAWLYPNWQFTYTRPALTDGHSVLRLIYDLKVNNFKTDQARQNKDLRSTSFPSDLCYCSFFMRRHHLKSSCESCCHLTLFHLKLRSFFFCGMNAVNRSQEYLNVSQTNTCSNSIREWIDETIICPHPGAMTYGIKIIALTQVRAKVCSTRFSGQLKLIASKTAPIYMRATVKLIWCHASFRKSFFMPPAHILVWTNSIL